jgi:MerR family mercuric resistance operon transcriptional regulator
MNDMTIGKAAQQAGVGVETVRFYEREGLIERPAKPSAGGFRVYPPETVERIRFIRQAQDLGFSLREVCELLDLRADPQADAADVRARATAKLANVNDKMRQLQRIKDALETLIAACPGHGALGCCSSIEALEGHDTTGNSGTRIRKRERKRA